MLSPATTAFRVSHAADLAALSRISYLAPHLAEDASRALGYTEVRFVQSAEHDTQVLVAADAGNLVVAFRGTSAFADLVTDACACMAAFPAGKVHRGFRAALDAVAQPLRDACADLTAGRALWLTGHSLGGSLALLAAFEAVFELAVPIHGVYVFGAARPGNGAFADAYQAKLAAQTWCFVRDDDPVPRLLPRAAGYRDAAPIVRLEHGEIIQDPASWLLRLSEALDPRVALADGGPIGDHAINRYCADLSALAMLANKEETTRCQLSLTP